MMLNDSTNRYGKITRLLHWLMALLVILQFLKLGDRIDDGEHWIGQTIVPWHVSFGALLLVLGILRVLWALGQKQRPQPLQTPLLVKAGHFLLYVSMLLVPISGILYLVGKGYGLKNFGVQLIAKSGVETAWMADLGSLHAPLTWVFIALVLGHAVAALFHHFVKGDGSLRRMVG
jgi:cytochrome b561